MDEQKPIVVGFHVMQNGALIKFYSNYRISITDHQSTYHLTITLKPPSFIHERILKEELPSGRLVFAFAYTSNFGLIDFTDGPRLKMGRLKKSTLITSMTALPSMSDNHFLFTFRKNYISKRVVMSFVNNNFLEINSIHDNDNFNYIGLADKSDILVFTRRSPDSIFLQSNPKKTFKFGHYRNNSLFWQYAYIDDNLKISPSAQHIACIVRYEFRLMGFDEVSNNYLHILDRQLNQQYQKKLNFNPTALLFLDNQHIAILGIKHQKFQYNPERDKVEKMGDIIIKVYHLKNNKVQKFILKKTIFLDPDILKTFARASVTPDGQMMTCDPTGEVVIHKIFHASIKLRDKIESILMGDHQKLMLLPKDIVNIIMGYAGFGLFQSKFQNIQEVDYLEKKHSLMSKIFRR